MLHNVDPSLSTDYLFYHFLFSCQRYTIKYSLYDLIANAQQRNHARSDIATPKSRGDIEMTVRTLYILGIYISFLGECSFAP